MMLNSSDHSRLRRKLEELACELANNDARGMRIDEVLKGSELTENQIDSALKNMASGRYRQILEAIQRINNGLYGVCGMCGQGIDEERLEIIPEATFCVTCQRNHELLAESEFNAANKDLDFR